MLFFIYLGLIAMERFLIEKIRVNVRHESVGAFTQAELLSILFTLISILGVYFTWKRAKSN
jgi:prolipoprotein diacylglyceryltransferase